MENIAIPLPIPPAKADSQVRKLDNSKNTGSFSGLLQKTLNDQTPEEQKEEEIVTNKQLPPHQNNVMIAFNLVPAPSTSVEKGLDISKVQLLDGLVSISSSPLSQSTLKAETENNLKETMVITTSVTSDQELVTSKESRATEVNAQTLSQNSSILSDNISSVVQTDAFPITNTTALVRDEKIISGSIDQTRVEQAVPLYPSAGDRVANTVPVTMSLPKPSIEPQVTQHSAQKNNIQSHDSSLNLVTPNNIPPQTISLDSVQQSAIQTQVISQDTAPLNAFRKLTISQQTHSINSFASDTSQLANEQSLAEETIQSANPDQLQQIIKQTQPNFTQTKDEILFETKPLQQAVSNPTNEVQDDTVSYSNDSTLSSQQHLSTFRMTKLDESFENQLQQASSPVNRQELVAQIVDRARLTLRPAEQSEMVMHLRPEHLGELTLRVSLENGLVSAAFHSDNHEVRQAIEVSLPQLKQELSQQGIKLDNVGVFSGSDQFFNNGQRPPHQQQPIPVRRNAREFVQAMESSEDTAVRAAEGVDYRV